MSRHPRVRRQAGPARRNDHPYRTPGIEIMQRACPTVPSSCPSAVSSFLPRGSSPFAAPLINRAHQRSRQVGFLSLRAAKSETKPAMGVSDEIAGQSVAAFVSGKCSICLRIPLVSASRRSSWVRAMSVERRYRSFAVAPTGKTRWRGKTRRSLSSAEERSYRRHTWRFIPDFSRILSLRVNTPTAATRSHWLPSRSGR